MSQLRAGSEEAMVLLQCSNKDTWSQTLQKYDKAVALVAVAKKKAELNDLDSWLNSEFVAQVTSRTPKRMSLEELSKVMTWKLIRGKFRPLQKLVDSNSAVAVTEASTESFKQCTSGNWKGAIKELTVLRGIGEATASAILAPLYPALCPFMADEVIDCTDAPKREYNMKAYTLVQSMCTNKAQLLSKASYSDDDCGVGNVWTAEMVGKALWTEATISRYGDADAASPKATSNPTNIVGSGTPSNKRKRR